ncbi:MAG TPA: hypothetical protein VF268_10755, partial [Gammaproteobacteria bacterium]
SHWETHSFDTPRCRASAVWVKPAACIASLARGAFSRFCMARIIGACQVSSSFNFWKFEVDQAKDD